MSLTDEQMFALLSYANDADDLDVSDEEIGGGHYRVKVYAEVARRAYVLGHTAGIHAARARVADYIERAAELKARPGGGLSDPLTAVAWSEAAGWCRDETIWEDRPMHLDPDGPQDVEPSPTTR